MANRRKKTLSSKEYKERFILSMNDDDEITTKDGKEKLDKSDKDWEQCYKKGNKAREQLPNFWFCSNSKENEVVSVIHKKSHLLKKYDSGYGRYSYHYNITCDNGERTSTKNMQCHNLARIVFGGLSYGIAEELLDKYGVFAFGTGEYDLHGHHIGSKDDNSPENIELLSCRVHRILHKAPNDVKSDKIGKFLTDYSNMACEEQPNKISVLYAGEKVDKNTLEHIEDDEIRVIYATDKDNIELSEEVLKELRNQIIIGESIDLLIDNYGEDYFNEPKYLCTKDENYSFYRCEKVEEEIRITEKKDTRELANKKYIMCYLNKDDKIECCIEKE